MSGLLSLKLNLHAFAYTIKDSVLVHICISRNAATRPDPQWSTKLYEFANFKLESFAVLSLIDIVVLVKRFVLISLLR